MSPSPSSLPIGLLDLTLGSPIGICCSAHLWYVRPKSATLPRGLWCVCGDDGMMLTAGGGLCREGQGEEPRVAGRVVPTTTARRAEQ